MITFGRVSKVTRGLNMDPVFYEDVQTCADGGTKKRVGSPCQI